MWISETARYHPAAYPPPQPVAALGDQSTRVLIVASNARRGRDLARLLLHSYHVELVEDSSIAFAILLARPPALVIAPADMQSAGVPFCVGLRALPGARHIPLIEIQYGCPWLAPATVAADLSLAAEYVRTQLAPAVELLLGFRYPGNLPVWAENTVLALVRAIEAKDPALGGHVRRLGSLAFALGERLGLAGDDLQALYVGGLLHDVGKLGVDIRIIQKAGPLNADEYHAMQQHTRIGEHLIQPLRCAASIAPIVRSHHERWDGSGYPDRLRGAAIPLLARIVAVADAFDAMTSQRAYNVPLSLAAAAEILSAGAGTAWDPDVVAAFLDWLDATQAGAGAPPQALYERALGA